MDRNKGLEFRKESSFYSNTGRSAKEENVQRNRGGQEGMPKKECQGEVRDKPFLKWLQRSKRMRNENRSFLGGCFRKASSPF